MHVYILIFLPKMKKKTQELLFYNWGRGRDSNIWALGTRQPRVQTTSQNTCIGANTLLGIS